MITDEIKMAIENVLERGDRVELIPGPNQSVKVLHIKRKIVKTDQKKDCLKD